jgi:hypothetical protein
MDAFQIESDWLHASSRREAKFGYPLYENVARRKTARGGFTFAIHPVASLGIGNSTVISGHEKATSVKVAHAIHLMFSLPRENVI